MWQHTHTYWHSRLRRSHLSWACYWPVQKPCMRWTSKQTILQVASFSDFQTEQSRGQRRPHIFNKFSELSYLRLLQWLVTRSHLLHGNTDDIYISVITVYGDNRQWKWWRPVCVWLWFTHQSCDVCCQPQSQFCECRHMVHHLPHTPLVIKG